MAADDDPDLTVIIKCCKRIYDVFLQDGKLKFDEKLNNDVGKHTKLTFGSHFEQWSNEYEVDCAYDKDLSFIDPALPRIGRTYLCSFLKKCLDNSDVGSSKVEIIFKGTEKLNGMTIQITQQDFGSALNVVFPSSKEEKLQLPKDLIPDIHVTMTMEWTTFDANETKAGVQQVVVKYTYPKTDLQNYSSIDALMKDKIYISVNDKARALFGNKA